MGQCFLISCYSVLQDASVTAIIVSKVLRENQQGRRGGKITPPQPPSLTRLGLTRLCTDTNDSSFP